MHHVRVNTRVICIRSALTLAQIKNRSPLPVCRGHEPAPARGIRDEIARLGRRWPLKKKSGADGSFLSSAGAMLGGLRWRWRLDKATETHVHKRGVRAPKVTDRRWSQVRNYSVPLRFDLAQ